MKLVTFETPIWATIQGEGTLVGVPSVFVRLHGCDYDCSWCDTKGSWQPGSTFDERSVEEVFESIQGFQEDFHIRHVVVTGGNPFLQGDDVGALIELLHRNHPKLGPSHVTIETQGSYFHNKCSSDCDLLSLSPKLHKWPKESLEEILKYRARSYFRSGIASTQVKIVVGSDDDGVAAARYLYDLYDKFGGLGLYDGLILQPEFTSGKKGKQGATNAAMIAPSTLWPYKHTPPTIKVIPQVHKQLSVR